MKYTVIALWEDSGEPYAQDVEAQDAFDAMHKIALQNPSSDFCIVGAIEGFHTLTAPCDESGKSAYGSDMAEGA